MRLTYLIIGLLLIFLYNSCGQPASISGVPSTGCSVAAVPANDYAPDGGTLFSCADGTSALILNGFSFRAIQFCKAVSNYPTVFPELGFCIDHNLYAVYSANNGFLVLVPPGVYDSNAIGSSCTFTVVDNCGIIN